MIGISPVCFHAAKNATVEPPAASTSGRAISPHTRPKFQSSATPPTTHFRDRSAPFTSQLKYRDGESLNTSWTEMIEIKFNSRDDPFEDGVAIGSPIGRGIDYAENTLGHIAAHATAHQAAQFHTHVLAALLLPTYMELLRRDYPRVIMSFQQLDNAQARRTPGLCGHDATIAKANLAENIAARIQERLSSQLASPSITMSVGQNEYITAEPSGDNTGAVAPTGLSMRCFKGNCMRNKRIVLLKDTWGVLRPTLMPEHETYQKLHANGVPNIPQCFDGKDVGGDDPNHGTQSRHWADRYNPNLTLREFQHHRIALEHMDRALEDFTDVRQMVGAIRDATEAHRQAVVLANTLHRDVCVGNIIMKMKDGEYKGFLIDWDLCLDLTQKGGAQLERTGTWQFTAIRLLEEPKGHETPVAERVDDVESFLHVLMWMALRYTAHSLAPGHLSSILRDNFDSSYTVGGQRYITSMRSSYMATRILLKAAKFTNKGIISVLRALSQTLCQRYVWPTLYPCDTSELAITLYQYSIQVRDEALEILQKDDAWLPNLLTEILEDPTKWEVDNEKVAHAIVDPHRN